MLNVGANPINVLPQFTSLTLKSLAAAIGLRPRVTSFPLACAADALAAIRSDAIDGAAVVVP